jgi:hypothetical protein
MATLALLSARRDADAGDTRGASADHGACVERAPAAAAFPTPALAALRGLIRDGKATRQLAEVAFLGAFCGHVRAAETIFQCLRHVCPGNPYVELGLAMVCSIAGRPQDGLALLEHIPPSQGALDGLAPLCAGLLLSDAGHRAAADRKFNECIARGGNAAQLALALSKPPRR